VVDAPSRRSDAAASFMPQSGITPSLRVRITCSDGKSRLWVRQKFKVFGHIGERTVLVAYASLQHKSVVSARSENVVMIRLGQGNKGPARRAASGRLRDPSDIQRIERFVQ
jgi:hypothetical protein